MVITQPDNQAPSKLSASEPSQLLYPLVHFHRKPRRAGSIILGKFFTVLVRGEPLLLSAGRAILVYVLMIQICIVSAFLLQYLTNSIARRVRLAMGLFTSGIK